MNMILSFIVPVYNIENYLPKCIDSIMAVSMAEIEIILVNDGSTDDSPQICDSYAVVDKRVKVIHQQNGGLSAARNLGIKKAEGDYIVFVDGDDWIDAAVIPKTSHFIKQGIDVIFLEIVKVFENNIHKPMGEGYDASKINGRSKKAILAHLAGLSKYPGSACAKIIRREIIISNNHLFEENLFSEDIDWTVGLFKHAGTFAYFSEIFYFYRQNRLGSITQGANTNRLKDLLYIINKHSTDNLSNHEFQEYINAFMSFEFVVALYLYGTIPKSDRRLFYTQLNNLKWVLGYSRNFKIKVIYMLCYVLGFMITAKMISVYRQITENRGS